MRGCHTPTAGDETRPALRAGRYGVALGLGMCLLAGCTRNQEAAPLSETPALRIGVLPDQSTEHLRQTYTPLMEYLRRAVDREIELVIPEDYPALVEAFSRKKIDLAWFGGLTFIQAESRCGAEPLVLRDVDLEFTSTFLVARESNGKTLRDYAGKRAAFGPRMSTSGHLMPRHMLHTAGIDPDSFFATVEHASGHDQTALWVQEGRADIGSANSVIVNDLIRRGRLDLDQVRILERTLPYRDYVWATQATMTPSLRQALLDAFLALDRTVPDQFTILRQLGATYYLPASSNLFKEIREAWQMLEGAMSESGT